MLLGTVKAVAVETMSLLDLLHPEGLLVGLVSLVRLLVGLVGLLVHRCRGGCVDSGARGLLITDLFLSDRPGEELSCSGGFGSSICISWGSLSGSSSGLLAFATLAAFTLATFTLTLTLPFTTMALSALGFTSRNHLISISDIPCGGGFGR
jgi:hypothetical protein